MSVLRWALVVLAAACFAAAQIMGVVNGLAVLGLLLLLAAAITTVPAVQTALAAAVRTVVGDFVDDARELIADVAAALARFRRAGR